ncbi:MAG TPA: DUF5719 family protein [Motilibacteraceae bacterium]|nr:DUF5719 family protein [Motilibacteraceae bacterium]
MSEPTPEPTQPTPEPTPEPTRSSGGTGGSRRRAARRRPAASTDAGTSGTSATRSTGTTGTPGTTGSRRGRTLTRPAAALAGVVALGLVTAGAAYATRPDAGSTATAAPAARVLPVASASAVCTDPSRQPDSQVRVAASTALAAAGGTGRLTLTDLAAPAGPGAPPPGASTTTVGAQASWSPTKGTPPVLAHADGALAPGLAATETVRTDSGPLRGLASQACPRPVTDAWFVGSGTSVGRTAALRLANPQDAPAVVDVAVFGSSGPVDTPGGRGLVVKPHAVLDVRLDALAPGLGRLAVHVTTRQGRIAPALRDAQVKGLNAAGVDWVPQAVAPGRHVVVPGIPPGQDVRLQVLVPGDAPAIAKLSLVAPDGSYTPLGLDVVEAGAGQVTEVDLTKALATVKGAAAVVLDSDVPLTAAVQVRRWNENSPVAETAWTAAGTSVDGEAVVVDAGTLVPTTVTHVLLAAPGDAARVELVPIAPDGTRGATARLTVPAGSTLAPAATALRTREGRPLTQGSVLVRVLPGSGPVYATRLVEEKGARGSLLTLTPVETAPRTVRAPAVQADLSPQG